MVTLDKIRAHSDPRVFPHHLLGGKETALVLFAAGFHGAQDAIWVHDAGLTATCVDQDAAKLGEMILAYPEGWEFVCGDAFEYANLTQRKWDVVTIDCPTNLFGRCADAIDLWCSLAWEAVVLGTGDYDVAPPDGWRVADTIGRSSYRGGVYWTVLVRC